MSRARWWGWSLNTRQMISGASLTSFAETVKASSSYATITSSPSTFVTTLSSWLLTTCTICWRLISINQQPIQSHMISLSVWRSSMKNIRKRRKLNGLSISSWVIRILLANTSTRRAMITPTPISQLQMTPSAISQRWSAANRQCPSAKPAQRFSKWMKMNWTS